MEKKQRDAEAGITGAMDKYRNALSRAEMDSLVEALPKSTNTVLTREFDPEGVVLSGGQTQKLAAARAFCQDTPIRIFDEPSSALDPASEYQLNQELREIKTVIFISHRLAAARDADCIYMMKEGCIVEQGAHAQLLALGGEYCKMWELQAQAYQTTDSTLREPPLC